MNEATFERVPRLNDSLAIPATDQVVLAAARGNIPAPKRETTLSGCGWDGASIVRALVKAGENLPYEIRKAAELWRKVNDAYFDLTPWQAGSDHQFAHDSGHIEVAGSVHKALEAASTAAFEAKHTISERICSLLESLGYSCSTWSTNSDSDSYTTTFYGPSGDPVAWL